MADQGVQGIVIKVVADYLLDRFLEQHVAEDFQEKLRALCPALASAGIDPFGFQPEFLRYVAPFAWFLHRIYFRTETFGLEQVPPGRVLLVANHSGQIALDGLIIATALIMDSSRPRILRSMIEKWVPTLPYVSIFMARCGQVVGLPENCGRLLQQEEAILVFPEGVRGISKTWNHRYQLQPFGQGFMRLAMEHRTPIVPVAVIGGEEQAPAFANFKPAARLIGAPSFPITPTFPWLLGLGLVPYPTRYRIHFGHPLYFEGDPLEDDEVVEQKVGEVHAIVQRMIRQGLKERRHVFW